MTVAGWMQQRTRWIKGWMQTFLVHNRHPARFLEDIGWRGFIAFQIYVGSLILSAPLHATFLLSTLAALLLPGGTPLTLGPWEAASLAVVAIGYGGAAALVVAGLLRIGRPDLLGYQALLPLYWILHSVAAVRALHELLTRPYFWAKTAHGQTRLARRVVQPE